MGRKLNLTRKARYQMSGFILQAEAEALKLIPLNAPYSILMRKERLRLLKRANAEGWSRQKFERAIAHQYTVRGWKDEGERIKPANVFRMVRDYQADWRNTAPPDEVDQWVSPSSKNKNHHGSNISRDKLLRAKRAYNALPETKLKRQLYRQKNKDKIVRQRRQYKEFKKNNRGL